MDQPLDIQDVRVVHFGLGALGSAIARAVAAREGLTSVAAIDTAAAREGRDLADVVGLSEASGIVVEGNPLRLHDIEADVVLFAPDGDPVAAITDLELLLEVGLNVVTVMPELAYPPDDEEDELAASIDTLAREAEVTALALAPSDALFGTLPLVLTSVCSLVDRVTIRRHGSGGMTSRVSVADWARALAGSLGWELDDLDDVDAAAGGAHRVIGSVGGRDVLVVEVVPDGGPAHLDVAIEGSPPLTLRVDGGDNVDQLLANLAVNAIPAVLIEDPGLSTIADLPPVHSWTSLALVPADGEIEDEDDE